MISLGVVDLGVVVIFLIAASILVKEKMYGFFYAAVFIFAILLVEQGLHFAARLAEKYVVMAKGAVVISGKSDELSAEKVKQYLTV